MTANYCFRTYSVSGMVIALWEPMPPRHDRKDFAEFCDYYFAIPPRRVLP